MITTRDIDTLSKIATRSIAALAFRHSFPFVERKRSVLPFILGGLGAAAIGGIAAVLIMSPRTRYRALDAAKDGYGKVRGQLQDGLAVAQNAVADAKPVPSGS